MFTRMSRVLSVGWKVAALALVGGAGAVGYVGYDGARDRVAETFGPPLEAGREWSGRAGERAADAGDRGLALVEQHPYLAASHLVGLLVFAVMVRHYRRKGFGTGTAVLAGLTKFPPTGPAGPLTVADREANQAIVERLERRKAALLKANQSLPRELSEADVKVRAKKKDMDDAEMMLDAAVDEHAGAVAARAEIAARLDQQAYQLEEIDDEIKRLKPLT